MFAHQMGIKLVAASGKIDIQAHSDNIEMTTAKDLLITALDNCTLKTKKFTIITEGATYEIGGGGIISKTSGAHVMHAGKHAMTEPAGGVLELPHLPQSAEKDHWLDLSLQHPDLTPAPGADYKVLFADGTLRSGKLDGQGKARLEGVPLGPAQAYFNEDARVPALPPIKAARVDMTALEQELRQAGHNPDEIDIAALLAYFAGRSA